MIEKITLVNEDSDWGELTMDMVTAPGFILESVDIGPVVGKHNTYKYFNQLGETVGSTAIGTREVSITGWTVDGASQSITELKLALSNFVNPLQPITLCYKPGTVNYALTFTPDSSIKYGTTYKDNNDKICKFNIHGIAYDPMFYKSPKNQLNYAPTSGAAYIQTTINCGADIPIGIEVEIGAKGTSSTAVKNPYIQNVTTGEKLTINVSLTSLGDSIFIDTRPGHKSIVNLAGENRFSSKTLDSSWVQLKPGGNTLRFGAESGINALSVKLSYQPCYWEVQE